MWRLFEKGAPALGRDHFEHLHLSRRDPWNFESSSYEARKREATLEALPRPIYDRALEIGCSIGVFTALLAGRCRTLLSVDVAESALVTARERCRDLRHVHFERMRVPQDVPRQRFDLMVLSEVGYFWSRRDLIRARRRLVNRLRPGGHLLLVHWTGSIPESVSPVTGDDVHRAFFAARQLIHRDGVRESAYRLDLFERRSTGPGDIVLAALQRLIRPHDHGVVVYADVPPGGLFVSSPDNAHRIVFRGWAGAREGIASVDVSLDGAAVGRASLGEARPDVAAHVPEFGENTGFTLELGPDDRVQGRRALQVTARSKRGRLARARADVDIRFRAPAFETTPRALPEADELARFLDGGSRLDFRPEHQASVSVVVVVYNRAELTLACLRSLRATTGAPFELILVDNASTDRTAELLGRIDGATIVSNPVNPHYVRAANQGARVARGEHVLLLNNDTEVSPESLGAAVSRLASDRSIGVVGGRLVLYNGRLQEAGAIAWRNGRCSAYGWGDAPDAPPYMFVREVDYCAGAFLLTPRALFESMGGLDERYSPGYYEDADYCLRVWELGRRVVFEPRAKLWHVEHGSHARADVARCITQNYDRFYERHRVRLAGHWTEEATHVGRARVRGTAASVLVIGDEIPLVGGDPAHERVRHRLRTLVAAGFVVTFHPLSSRRASWEEVYRATPETVEVMNGYGSAFLRPLLDDRAGEYAAIVLSSRGALGALTSEGHGHNDPLFFDAWAADVPVAEGPSGMPWLRGADDLEGLTRAAHAGPTRC